MEIVLSHEEVQKVRQEVLQVGISLSHLAAALEQLSLLEYKVRLAEVASYTLKDGE